MAGKNKGKAVSGTGNHEGLKEALNALEPKGQISGTEKAIEKYLPLFRATLERGVPPEEIFEVLKKHGLLTIRFSTFRQYMKKYGIEEKIRGVVSGQVETTSY